MTVHEPAPVMCTVLPTFVQSPLVVKLTAKPEVAMAFTLKSGSVNVVLANAPNEMVWFAWKMLNVRSSFGAGLWLPSPPWDDGSCSCRLRDGHQVPAPLFGAITGDAGFDLTRKARKH